MLTTRARARAVKVKRDAVLSHHKGFNTRLLFDLIIFKCRKVEEEEEEVAALHPSRLDVF